MKTAGCRTLLIGALALLGGGCGAADVTAVPEPVAGDSATRASYAYSTPYGEMWEVDGEVMPVGYGAPWSAQIFGGTSSIDWSVDCGSSCDVGFKAYMTGLWHATNQTIHWQVNGQGGSAQKAGVGWSCAWRLGPLNCAMAERSDVHRVMVQDCRWSAKVNTDHAAWWRAWFDLESREMKLGEVGRIGRSSLGQDRTVDLCPGPGDSWSGQPSGPGLCYDAYLAWTDELGYHEVFLGTWCFAGWAT